MVHQPSVAILLLQHLSKNSGMCLLIWSGGPQNYFTSKKNGKCFSDCFSSCRTGGEETDKEWHHRIADTEIEILT